MGPELMHPYDDVSLLLGTVGDIFRDDFSEDVLAIPRLPEIWHWWQGIDQFDILTWSKGYILLSGKVIEAIRHNNSQELGYYHDEIIQKVEENIQGCESQGGNVADTLAHWRMEGLSFISSAQLIRVVGEQLKKKTWGDQGNLVAAARELAERIVRSRSSEDLSKIRDLVATSILQAVTERTLDELDLVADEVGEASDALSDEQQSFISCQLDGIYYVLETLLAKLDLDRLSSSP